MQRSYLFLIDFVRTQLTVAAAAVLGEHLHEHVAAVELVVHLELARRERAQLLRRERAVARAHQRLARSLCAPREAERAEDLAIAAAGGAA